MRRLILAVLAAVFVGFGITSNDAVAAPTYQLFGHDNNAIGAETVAIDKTTGVKTVVGGNGLNSGASGMATSRAVTSTAIGSFAAGTHFGLLRTAGVDKVVVVDTVTGVATPVVTTSRLIGGRGIGFGSDGATLYVIEGGAGPLSTIDLNTGLVTLVGNTSAPAASLEWDPMTSRFLSISGSTLFGITEAAAATPIGSTGGGSCTLTRDPGTGTWYTIIASRLHTLNPSTGATTVVAGAPATLGGVCGTAFAPPRALTISVDIDIKPGSDPNSINLNGNGVVPVGVFGSSTFDVNDIDVSTVVAGVDADSDGDIDASATPAAALHGGHIEDLDGDGEDDIVFHFREHELGIDTSTPGNTILDVLLVGELNDATAFVGVDVVRITPNNIDNSRGKGGKGPK